jgi:hypothetical protein
LWGYTAIIIFYKVNIRGIDIGLFYFKGEEKRMDLKEARFKKGISQWGLRMQTGINQTKICLIEKGYVTPTDEEKRVLAEALGVEASEIIWPEVPILSKAQSPQID